MRGRLIRFIRLGMLVYALSATVASPVHAQQAQAQITALSGRVELRNGAAEWRLAEVGEVITAGTTISTGFGAEAVIRIGESSLQVRELTRMTLENLVERENSIDTDLFLRVGRVRSEVRTTRGLQNNFQLRSTQATAAVRGTSFDFDGINLHVDEGLVSIANRLGKLKSVRRGQSSKVEGFKPPQNPKDIAFKLLNVSPYTSRDETGAGPGKPSGHGLVVVRILWE